MTKSSGRRNLGGMTTVNISDAKARHSALIAEAEAGGDVIIARAGQPVVRLVRVDTHRQPRIPGRSRGQIEMSEDFDQPMPDLESMIYGTGE